MLMCQNVVGSCLQSRLKVRDWRLMEEFRNYLREKKGRAKIAEKFSDNGRVSFEKGLK